MSDSQNVYFIPEPSRWPIVGSIALFTTFVGTALLLNGVVPGIMLLIAGFAAIVCMFYGWFSDVILESTGGKYNSQVDTSFRWGMSWFIFSEVMFFAAFFGALFYTRNYSVPWLGGEGAKILTHEYLWPVFNAVWPLKETPDTSAFTQIKDIIPAWGIPAINTIVLLSSGGTVTLAHWSLKKNNRKGLCWWLFATVFLGVLFVYLQAGEYVHAYHELDLKLSSGVYGSTFFMLTGFHGFHVTMGAVMLLIILLRSLSGHFSEHNHFAFEAVAWYWHFVDVVWLFLFVFVYWL